MAIFRSPGLARPLGALCALAAAICGATAVDAIASTSGLSASSPLGTAIGFGRNATVPTAVYHVTTNGDSPSSPQEGTLRWGLSQTTPMHIVFDGDYTISFAAGMPVSPDKTIDGRGHRIVLTGHGQPGLQLYSTHNVIIENLVLHDFGDIAKTACCNDPNDAIDVADSRDVWIDHNDLSMAGDKLISLGRGSTNATISWNHFHDQVDTVQLGNQATAELDAAMDVTLHHNFFDHTAHRNPVVSYGRAHSFDNYILDWLSYGARSERAAQLYLEDNIFEAGTNKAATKTLPGGDGCNDAKTLCDTRPGYLKSVGNLALNGAVITENHPELVFTPSSVYSYQAEAATTALKAEIVADAGWQSS